MLLEKLHEKSGVSLSKLDWIAQTASRRYKVYEIPKRTGGTRTIAHPSRALKAIQRWICAVVIKTLPVHESSTAYSKGSGIRQNAERHMQSEKTVRIDFRDFFSIFSVASR